MPKFRKKPVVIEAIQYHKEKIHEVLNFFEDNNAKKEIVYKPDVNEYAIKTLEGEMFLTENDWIIKGVNNEFYPCKPDIFEKTYEPINH